MGLYEYRAEVLRVVDGDTIWLSWKDYGDGLKIHGGNTSETALSYRLAAINVYEKTRRFGTTEEEKQLGIAAMNWLKDLVEGKTVLLKSVKAGARGNYGRYLVYAFLDVEETDFDPLDGATCINLMLLEKGWALVSKYDDGETYEGLGYARED